jgi:hypothetical protein
LRGVLEKVDVFCVVFDGDFVVDWVVKRGGLRVAFWRLKIFHWI